MDVGLVVDAAGFAVTPVLGVKPVVAGLVVAVASREVVAPLTLVDVAGFAPRVLVVGLESVLVAVLVGAGLLASLLVGAVRVAVVKGLGAARAVVVVVGLVAVDFAKVLPNFEAVVAVVLGFARPVEPVSGFLVAALAAEATFDLDGKGLVAFSGLLSFLASV